MSKRVKYFSFAIAIIAVAAVMTIAIYAATAAGAGITANVSWTATEGISFELEAWVVNNSTANGIGATTIPKAITKQIVTANTSNTAANNLAGDLACGFYDGSDDGVNNPSNIVFTYKIKNTGSGILKVTATKTPTNSAESGTTAANHKPAVALSSKLDSTDNTSSCISSITGSGFNIPAGKTLEYIVTLSISNADLSITNYDAGVTFSFGTGSASSAVAGTPTIYVNGVQQSSPAVDGATTVGDYLDALDGSQYPGYFYDEDLTIYAGEDDIVTNDTKLYTKPATLDKLAFYSNGDGTCGVTAKGASPLNSKVYKDYGKTSIKVVAPGATELSGEIVIPRFSSSDEMVTIIKEAAFYLSGEVITTGLVSIILPDTIKDIRARAFMNCKGLTSITVPNSVTNIGDYAFNGCGGLTSIIVSSGNQVYDSRNNCNAIIETASNTLIAGCKNTVIPNNVTSIGSRAFLSCTGLTSMYIPSSVTTISASDEYDAPFYNCSSLLKIYCGASSKPSGWSSYWNYYSETGQLSVTWGVTREQYNSQYA